ncbi:MAG: hypothetical protein M3530_03950 [Thermoproteota archaeon]|nr:hypothetical protein [Thermoproteota archaeon]
MQSIRDAGFKDITVLKEQLYMDEIKTNGRKIKSLVIRAITGCRRRMKFFGRSKLDEPEK